MNISMLQKMSIEELRTLKLKVDKIINIKVLNTIGELKIGDPVKINHVKVAGLRFTVVKINRKKIRVKQNNSSTTYNVSMSLIEKI